VVKRKKKLTLAAWAEAYWKKTYEDKPKNRWKKGWQTRRKNNLMRGMELLTTPNPVFEGLVWKERK
jgi:hypothetical protein